MMRSIAEFIMKGRLQAALLAILGLPLLSTATVGLVTLRLGHQQGTLLMFIALIPTLVGVAMGRMPEILFWLNLIAIFSVFVYGVLLRASVSWMFTLIGSCALMVVVLPLLAWQFDGLRESISQIITPPQMSTEQEPVLDTDAVVLQSIALVSGIVALIATFNGITSIVFARWMQSLLYNPGGFGEEFQALRLDIAPAIVLVALAAFCFMLGTDYRFWSIVFSTPLVIAAFALVHFYVNAKAVSSSWLICFYIFTVFYWMPMIVMLTVIGLFDAVFNFRKRL